jgi:two-component system CheB/CheR fusion protein
MDARFAMMEGMRSKTEPRERKRSSPDETGSAERTHTQTATELKQTLERYELIFQATHDILYDLDLESGTVVWNDALRAQFGYSAKELSGTLEWWAQAIYPDDALRVEQEVAKWFDSDATTWQTEYRFRKADGTYCYVRDRGFLQRSPSGEPIRIIGSLLDITKQKEMDIAKDEFISLVSHQLRTPLTVIRLYSEMLTNGFIGSLDKAQEAHIARITSASVRLIKLVEDILNVSRIELDRITINPTATDPNKLIEAAIADITPIANEKGVTIVFEPDNTLRPLALDDTIFSQIVHNFLTNAVRYTQPMKGHVDIVFVREDDGYVLTVRDNGIGIPDADQPHIFSRFYRANNAVNIEQHGTGLGLYLVRLMAEAFSGRVWFESAMGRGTTFFLQLPLNGMSQTVHAAL